MPLYKFEHKQTRERKFYSAPHLMAAWKMAADDMAEGDISKVKRVRVWMAENGRNH